MPSPKVVLYIAMSLDGYIAKENDDIGFLSLVESPPEDYGYREFIATVDTVIMGRKTYEKVLSFGIEFPHSNKTCYVLSHSKTGSDNHVTFYNGDILELIHHLRETSKGNIFIDGGAETAFSCLRQGLIDTFVISIIPVLLGSGIRLFKEGTETQLLTLTRSLSYPTGLVQLWYERK